MTEEGNFPKTDDNLTASTKRLADWTFSLQGVGAELKALLAEFKAYWRDRVAPVSTRVPTDAPAGRVMSTVNPYYSPNESIHDNTAPVLRAEAKIEGEKVKGWVSSVMLALSIMVNVVLMGLYLHSQQAVNQSYVDAKKQVWLKQDKEEESFQKFVAGPYAALAGKVEASQILFSKCKESH